jgi:hypothetical protein
VPNSSPRTAPNRILRDYLLAALRCSPRPLSTTELRQSAPAVAVPGSARPLPPTQETIYRLLRCLQDQGAVAAVAADGPQASARTWTAIDNPGADEEIALLDALFAAPAATPASRAAARPDRCRRHRR